MSGCNPHRVSVENPTKCTVCGGVLSLAEHPGALEDKDKGTKPLKKPARKKPVPADEKGPSQQEGAPEDTSSSGPASCPGLHGGLFVNQQPVGLRTSPHDATTGTGVAGGPSGSPIQNPADDLLSVKPGHIALRVSKQDAPFRVLYMKRVAILRKRVESVENAVGVGLRSVDDNILYDKCVRLFMDELEKVDKEMQTMTQEQQYLFRYMRWVALHRYENLTGVDGITKALEQLSSS
jgi:hypothetical protein